MGEQTFFYDIVEISISEGPSNFIEIWLYDIVGVKQKWYQWFQ